MSETLSIFDAADEEPERLAIVDGSEQLTFREIADRSGSPYAALLAMRAPALSLTPRANIESLSWLYAAFAAGVPVLTLHQRATEPERRQAASLVGAVEPPALGADSERRVLRITSAADPFVYIPTSGSTGTPRLVELSRGAVLASARASAQNLGWHEDDRWLVCLPLAHTGGLSIVIRCLLARRAVVLFEASNGGLLAHAERLAEVAQTVTLISLVPSVLERLLDIGFTPPPRLRAVLLGGSGCSPALARRAHAPVWSSRCATARSRCAQRRG
jgi:o-succinylbenzoate---CoA ligase